MKKIFIVFFMLCCVSVFAEKYRVGYNYLITIFEFSDSYKSYLVSAVYPYQNGYIIKLTCKDVYKDGITTLEIYYDDKNSFIFYTPFNKETIIKCSPNSFETEIEPVNPFETK